MLYLFKNNLENLNCTAMKEMIKINGRVSKTGNNEQIAIDIMDDSTIGLAKFTKNKTSSQVFAYFRNHQEFDAAW